VIGRRNQLRIVLGSEATGGDLIGELLEESASSLGTFDLICPQRRVNFVNALIDGDPGTQHRVVYSDVSSVREETILNTISRVASALPDNGVTRSAVLYMGANALDQWLRILDPVQGSLAADCVVACRRLDRLGAEGWSHNQRGQFTDPTDRAQLLHVTGGWPLLIDTVAAHIGTGASATDALAMVRSELDSDLGARLVTATGLPGSALEAAYSALVALGPELLIDVVDDDVEAELRMHHERPPVAVAGLVAVGALNRTPAGTLHLEPVLARLWNEYHK
jgi:hypothetical protein